MNAARFRRVVSFLFLGLSLLGLLGLSACGLLPAGQTPAPALPSSAATDSPALATPTPLEPAVTTRLALWVPPQFNPDGSAPGARLLRQRLDEFMLDNPGVEIEVRVRPASGPGSLLEFLTATSLSAPENLPAVIALPRGDMEMAAVKGLIFPLDTLTPLLDANEWYPYAYQLALLQGQTFGAPLAGDALVLVYRPISTGPLPGSWAEILARGLPLAFPAADPLALFYQSLYLSTGANYRDLQNRPAYDLEKIEQIFQLIDQATQQGVFPYWLTDYTTYRQTWDAFIEKRVDWAVVWASDYLSALPADVMAAPLPSLGDKPAALATGWFWAVAEPNPARQELAARLVEFLSAGEFLDEYNAQTGYLPVHVSTLTAWKDPALRTLVQTLAEAAFPQPDAELSAPITPVLADLVQQTVKGLIDPRQAVSEFQNRVESPQP